MSDTKKNTSTRSTADRVPLSMKFGYSIADFGHNLGFHTTGFYLMFFFTDVFGIVPALAGIIFLYSKMWDGVSDPIMGYIADKTSSRWGKMRPYLLFGAVPLCLAIYLLFYSPDISADMKFYYGLITFIFFCTTITIVNVPYLAMTPSITMDSHERSVITGFRVVFGIMGALAAAGATLPLVGLFGGEDKVAGFRSLGLLYGIVVAVVTIFTFMTVKERITTSKETVKASFRDDLRVVLKNKPFMILTAGVLMFMIGMNIMAVVVNYFFKYNLKSEQLIPVAFLALFVTAGASIPLFVFISKKTSKRFTYNLGMGIVALLLVFMFFFGERSPYLTIFFFVLAGVGLSTNWLSPWSMIPDTVEYSEWKTGLRREGSLYGIFYFVFKFGTAVAGFIVGYILDLIGYVPNVEQTEGALFGIRAVLALLPIVFLIGGIVLLSFYPLDAAMHKKITEEIESRKEA